MRFYFEATGIGSVPFTDPKRSCEIIFNRFKDIPFWPQLLRRSYLENMYVQFSEGMPGVVVNEAARSIRVDSLKALDQAEEFFRKFLDGDVDYFMVSRGRAMGLYEFLDTLRAGGQRYKFLKGQVTGPVSFALTILDENSRPIIYNPDLCEAVTKLLSMKARWQIRQLKEFSENIIIFIDEPYLVSIGSSYTNIDVAKAMGSIDELAGVIRSEGAMVGLHCCGNTDWPAVLKRDIDILNFDAYNFMTKFTIFPEEVKDFLVKGGTLAWGLVPTTGIKPVKESVKVYYDFLKEGIAAMGLSDIQISSIVTPSCGTGTMSEAYAERILDSTSELSAYLKDNPL